MNIVFIQSKQVFLQGRGLITAQKDEVFDVSDREAEVLISVRAALPQPQYDAAKKDAEKLAQEKAGKEQAEEKSRKGAKAKAEEVNKIGQKTVSGPAENKAVNNDKKNK